MLWTHDAAAAADDDDGGSSNVTQKDGLVSVVAYSLHLIESSR
jgi:hypothetical protein